MTTRRTFLITGSAFTGALAGALAYSGGVLAASNTVFVNSAGVAINGTDPVGYFKEDKPVEGSPDFATEWMGAIWHFASAENRDLFASAPEDYAPQYGGYCAFALAKGALANSVPEAWTIYNEKLYLNQSLRVRDIWLRDKDNLIRDADANWPGIVS
jgi:YHS domain-containing protein